jgi:hypothetical protein
MKELQVTVMHFCTLIQGQIVMQGHAVRYDLQIGCPGYLICSQAWLKDPVQKCQMCKKLPKVHAY